MDFHAKAISLSYRYRGRVARAQIQKKATLILVSLLEAPYGQPSPISIAVKNLINKILPYSAIKINANPPALYSILNPETNSDSPSAKSKGVRLVSANPVISHSVTKMLTMGATLKFRLISPSILNPLTKQK